MSDPNLHTRVKFPAHMTDEEHTELINKIHAHREYARMARSLFDAKKGVNVLATTETDRITGEIVSLVNDVLATRAAEIARLQTRQITPEIEQMCEDFIAQNDNDSYPMSRREETAAARSIGLKLVRWIKVRQETEESDS